MNFTVFLDTKYFDAKVMLKFEYELWAPRNNINFKQRLKYILWSYCHVGWRFICFIGAY